MSDSLPFDYDAVAARYDRYRTSSGPFVDPLLALAREAQPRTVLEIGPGTGNYTQVVAEGVDGFVVGVDASLGMLRRARAKLAGMSWVQGDALRLPIADGSIDFAYAILVLQHIPDLTTFLAECRRIVRGSIVFVTASHEFIERHPMNAYFPSFAAVDKARFPDIRRLQGLMREAGFTDVRRRDVAAPARPIDAAYVEKVRNRFISTYDLLPAGEFRSGLARLEREIEAAGELSERLVWEAAIVDARAG